MSKNILVTGAAGFIGSHLCEQLLQLGYQVSGIDNFDPFYPRAFKERNLSGIISHELFDFIEGDAGDEKLLEKIKNIPEVVIHLAAKAGVQPSLKSPGDYIRSNILLTNNLLEWMKLKGISKLIFGSSSSVYGDTTVVPFKEDQQVDTPFSPYAFTKRSCELMNYTYHKLYKFDILNLRFFTVYGERQRPDLAIYKFVNSISEKKPVHLYGDGSTSRDYTYWRDTVNGILAALEYIISHIGVYESVNIGNNTPVKLSRLIESIAVAINESPVIVYENKKPGDVDITFADISKAKNLFNYHPQTNLPEGLKNFVSWFKKEIRSK